jgi:hypothetical protein
MLFGAPRVDPSGGARHMPKAAGTLSRSTTEAPSAQRELPKPVLRFSPNRLPKGRYANNHRAGVRRELTEGDVAGFRVDEDLAPPFDQQGTNSVLGEQRRCGEPPGYGPGTRLPFMLTSPPRIRWRKQTLAERIGSVTHNFGTRRRRARTRAQPGGARRLSSASRGGCKRNDHILENAPDENTIDRSSCHDTQNVQAKDGIG